MNEYGIRPHKAMSLEESEERRRIHSESMPVEHEFIRYVQRMVGRRIYYQALCSCKWRSVATDRSTAWAEWNDHRHEKSQLVIAGLKQALTGQEP